MPFFLHWTRPCDTTSPSSGRSAVWSAHLPWEQGAGGSNPPVPTSMYERAESAMALPLYFLLSALCFCNNGQGASCRLRLPCGISPLANLPKAGFHRVNLRLTEFAIRNCKFEICLLLYALCGERSEPLTSQGDFLKIVGQLYSFA